jgi:hypothetical protein
VREAFARLARDLTLVTLALGVALGWALFQVAQGISEAITTLLKHYPSSAFYDYQPLTWHVGGRVVLLLRLVQGLIELAVLLLLAAWVRSRFRHPPEPNY